MKALFKWRQAALRRKLPRWLIALPVSVLLLTLALEVYLSESVLEALHRGSPAKPDHAPGQPAGKAHAASGGIFYLDLALLAPYVGLPKCDLEDPLGPALAVQKLAAQRFPHIKLHHSLDQHAGAWFFGQALRASTYLAQSIKRASHIYIDLECYYMWAWFATNLTPADYQQLAIKPEEVFNALMAVVPTLGSPAQMITYFPAPSIFGDCARYAWLREAQQIVVERQASCASYERTVVAPYSANLDAPANITFTNRTTLLTYIGGAADAEDRSAGQRMRYHVSSHLKGAANVFVYQGCLGCHGQMPHDEVVRKYQQSRFCLVMPGDTQSSRRATEVIINGCLPVFAGPPFNTIPLASQIRADAFSLLVRIKDTTPWATTTDQQWQTEHWEADIQETHVIADVTQLLPVIAAVSMAQITAMQRALEAERRKLLYRSKFDAADPSAVDLIMNALYPVRL